MRRPLGVCLTGLGAFLVAVGLIFWIFIPGQVVKYPLNEHSITTLVGSNMEYFSTKQVKELTGVSVKTINTVQGDVAAGGSSNAVWNSFTAVQDETNDVPISYSSARYVFNRRTGDLVNCCGAAIGSDTTVHWSGLGPVFGFNVKKKTYQIFDSTLLKPEPLTYAGTATFDGMSTYKYVETVNDQQFGTQSLPGSLVGLNNQASVTLPEVLTERNAYYVDPTTGGAVNVTEYQSVTLQDQGVTKLTLLQGTLASTPASISAAVKYENGINNEIDAVQDIVPLVGVLLGLVALVFGLLMIRSAPTYDERYEQLHGGADDADETVGSDA